MSAEGAAPWPGGARGALCLSFDNLGEAAEIGVGATARDDPGVGAHVTATEVVPGLLERLAERGLRATFFVEGLNAEIYPELLRRIDSEGHEVAFHAWAHEQWAALDAAGRAENLERGIAAFDAIGLRLRGIRPPGGALGENGAAALRRAGLAYASPAGEGAGVEAGLALLPFAWRHVDVSSTLPQLGTVREQIAGSTEPLDSDAFVSFLQRELDRLLAEGGFMTTVLHPFLIEPWLGWEGLGRLLDRVAAAAAGGELLVGTFDRLARWVAERPEAFAAGTTLDPTSWAA